MSLPHQYFTCFITHERVSVWWWYLCTCGGSEAPKAKHECRASTRSWALHVGGTDTAANHHLPPICLNNTNRYWLCINLGSMYTYIITPVLCLTYKCMRRITSISMKKASSCRGAWFHHLLLCMQKNRLFSIRHNNKYPASDICGGIFKREIIAHLKWYNCSVQVFLTAQLFCVVRISWCSGVYMHHNL